jgi:hypothetical protein
MKTRMSVAIAVSIALGSIALGIGTGSQSGGFPVRALASAPLKFVSGYLTCSSRSRNSTLQAVHLMVSADVIKKMDELNSATADDEHTLRRAIVALEAGAKPGTNRWFVADAVLNPAGFVQVSYTETLSLGQQRKVFIEWSHDSSAVTYTSKLNSISRSGAEPQTVELTCGSIRI